MGPNRFQLSGPSLEGLRKKAKAVYGDDAKIVRAEEVTIGGLAGFFAKHHFEITVEVPDRSAPTTDQLPLLTQPLKGLAALLAEADSAEADFHDVQVPSVSTSSVRFETLLQGLESAAQPAPRRPKAQTTRETVHVLAGPGDLIVVAGPRDDAVEPAAAIAASLGMTAFFTGGALTSTDGPHLSNRQEATAARAKGVEAAVPVVVAFGLGRPAEAFAMTHGLRALAADQIWAAVDATRKHDDTVRWVEAIESVVSLYAVAGFSRADTGTPETINALGLPIRWWEQTQPG